MKSKDELCPVCGEGHLYDQVRTEMYSYKGKEVAISDFYCLCDVCGAELALDGHAKKNKREVIRARRIVDRIPIGVDIRAFRESLGLTQQSAGRLFGGGPVAFSKYENDDLTPDLPMVKLLKVSMRHPVVALWLADDEGMELPAISGVRSSVNVTWSSMQENEFLSWQKSFDFELDAYQCWAMRLSHKNDRCVSANDHVYSEEEQSVVVNYR